MPKRIVVIQAHPDPDPERFCRLLSNAYIKGAHEAGNELRLIDLARLDIPLLRSQQEWLEGGVPPSLRAAQSDIDWAEHIVIFYPLWMGTMPALLKAFLEQVLRPGFAFTYGGAAGLPKKLLKGRSARIVVTMGMPALFYRGYFLAHSLKSLKRNILGFCGIGPIRTTLVGAIDSGGNPRHQKWIAKLWMLGLRGR